MLRKFVLVINLFISLASYPVLAQNVPLIVTTIKPFALIVQQLAGEQVAVQTLVPPGMSPHAYEPSPSEMKMVSRARLVIYGAEDLDGWVKKMSTGNSICLLELLPDSLKLVNDAADHSQGHEQHHHHGEYDPHFWTDPLAVKALLQPLSQQLQKVFPRVAGTIHQNAELFAGELDSLDREISRQLEPLQNRKLAVSHSFFNYFLNRYRFQVVATIEPVAGVETSPRHLVQIITQLKTQHVAGILVHPQLPERAAKVVSESSGIPTISLDPLGAGEEINSYSLLIGHNLQKLAEGLR